jgi:hypothetical protein
MPVSIFRNLTDRAFRSRTLVINPGNTIQPRKLQEQAKAVWHPVFPAQPVNLSPIVPTVTQPVSFGDLIPEKFPELGVLEIPGGILLNNYGWIADKEGKWLPELSWFGSDSGEIPLTNHHFRVKRKKGSCLCLASDWSDMNYSHFLLDSLGRFELFVKAGFNPNTIDYIYCPAPNAHTLAMLSQLKIGEHQLLGLKQGESLQFDRLIATSYPGVRRVYPAWLSAFLKSQFTGSPRKKFRKLYIPRTHSRKVSNEYQLKAILERYGYIFFDPGDQPETPQYFAEATHVAGAHGAGLANITFCQPGTRVLELMPSDHVFPHWYSLSKASGLDYNLLQGKSTSERTPPYFGPSPYDFYIDPEEFEKALIKMDQTMP